MSFCATSVRKNANLLLQIRYQLLVSLDSAAVQAHLGRHARVPGEEIYPLATRAGHLPLHLIVVTRLDDHREQQVDMARCLHALDLDDAVIAHEAVRARVSE